MPIQNNIPRKKHRSALGRLFWMILFVVFFIELLAYTWVRTESTHQVLDISKCQAALTKAQSYQKALLVERDRLKSDDRITRIALTQLDLTGDISFQTIYLDKAGIQ
jgi:hypothetical protein